MVTLADKYAILGQHASADMARAQADQMRSQSMAREAYHARMAEQNPQNVAMRLEQARLANEQARSNIGSTDAQTNRTNMLSPYERDKMGAETNKINRMLPYEQQHMAAQSGLLGAQAYGARQVGYGLERENTPPGSATPTDPRSLAYGGGPRTVHVGDSYAGSPPGGMPYTAGVGGGMATADGSYGPAPSGARRPAEAPIISPAKRRTPMAGPADAFGDGDPLVTPTPTSLNSTAGLVSSFSDPFAARGMTNFSGNGLSSRARAGTGIYQAPASSFTSMIGKDPAIGLADTKDPITGQGYGMVPSSSGSFGWENPAGKRY